MPISTIDIIGTTAAHEKCGADPPDVKFISFLLFLSIAKNLSMEVGRLKSEQIIGSLVLRFVSLLVNRVDILSIH